MTNPDIFESPKSLLNWAYDDLLRFKELERAFFESEPYERFVEFDSEFQRNAHRIRFTETPPDEMRKHASHIVNDLRHSLDQAYVTAARYFGWKPTQKKKFIYFPWAINKTDLKHLLKTVPEEIHRTMYDVQPYFTQDDGSGGDNIVRELGKIAGPNKHEVALTSLAIARVSAMKIDWNADFRIPYASENGGENEVTLGYFPVDTDGNYDAEVTMLITFLDNEKLRSYAASDLLEHWGSYANHVVKRLEARVIESNV